MTRDIRTAAVHLVLIALLLRALVPMGWMPGSAQLGQAAFVICTADGGIQHGVPGKDDSKQDHQPCAFAAAHVMASPVAGALAVPLLQTAATDATTLPPPAQRTAGFTPQSPRAPPVSV